MKCCLSDLRYKEVIDQSTGQRLGYVCDAEIDLDDGKIVSLIVPGQKKLGGLLSGDDDYILPWGSISRLGEDIILAEVSGQQPRRRREKRQNHLRAHAKNAKNRPNPLALAGFLWYNTRALRTGVDVRPCGFGLVGHRRSSRR